LKFSILSVLLLLILSSCSENRPVRGEKPVARVMGKYLYESDMAGLVPADATSEDSMAIISSFINNWIKNQLLLSQADKNLTSQQKDFTRQLEEYRNSLIIYAYESELVRQNLDTIISDSELEKYYNENIENFVLKDDIIRFFYIKMRSDSPALTPMVKLFRKNFARNQDSLVYYAINFSEDYSLVTEEWVPLNHFLSKVPLTIENPKIFLDASPFVEIPEEPYRHLIYFIDYKLKGNTAPFLYTRENIRLVLLNHRKQMLIREMHQKIYEQARDKNDFEYF